MNLPQAPFACDQMILIGSTARNVGKTEFACRLIEAQAEHGPVIGVKITAIRDDHHGCPRGSDGCGTCTRLQTPFLLTEENDRTLAKDTARMLRAGASQVYWLRAHPDGLESGVAALLAHLPAHVPVVCESSSARSVLQPGAFLIIRPAADAPLTKISPTMAALADRMPIFQGTGWDFSPTQCHFTHSRWRVPLAASAVVLAGGQSRRMGSDKSLLTIDGEPLIARICRQIAPHFSELMISSNTPETVAFLGYPVVTDPTPHCGPLMGIASAISHAQEELLFVLGCDIPDIDLSFVRSLFTLAQTADAVVPVSADGRPDPLFAFYRRTVLPAARAALQNGQRRVIAMLDGLKVVHPPMAARNYANLNTPEDVLLWQERKSHD